jgi:RsiW-degrading membrane proteinase PrsW (M82 family)
MRVVGATMLHALASGVVGYFWAKGVFRGALYRQLAIGIVLATGIHVVFNYLVVVYQEKDLLIYPALFLTAILFFVLTDFEILRDDEHKLEEKSGVVVQ